MSASARMTTKPRPPETCATHPPCYLRGMGAAAFFEDWAETVAVAASILSGEDGWPAGMEWWRARRIHNAGARLALEACHQRNRRGIGRQA